MAEPFVGEIRMVGFNFAPAGWALCNGQLLAISQNTTLFELIGTTYGGDGMTTYQLPNLQSRFPIHMGSDGQGNDYVIGRGDGDAVDEPDSVAYTSTAGGGVSGD